MDDGAAGGLARAGAGDGGDLLAGGEPIAWGFGAPILLAKLPWCNWVTTIASRMLIFQRAGLAGLNHVLQRLANKGRPSDAQFTGSLVDAAEQLLVNCDVDRFLHASFLVSVARFHFTTQRLRIARQREE